MQKSIHISIVALKKYIDLQPVNKIVKILLCSLLIWLFTRIFILQSFNIHTGSMHQTLMEGDYILVNKMAYGARLPITVLSWPWGQHRFFEGFQLPYLRMPGYASVKHNDVIVFNLPQDTHLPVDERQQYVKRCVALPGDTLLIAEGQVFINGIELQESPNILYSYTLTTVGKGIDTAVLGQLEGYIYDSRFNRNNFNLFLSVQNADSVKRLAGVVTVEKNTIPPDSYSPKVFPNSSLVKWNIDNFGPVVIPKMGNTIPLTEENKIIYKRIIELDEKNKIVSKGDSVFINNTFSDTYTFKQNYYFTMGDNRYNSIDSRYWGFVPDNHLIGKASFVLFSSKKSPLTHQSRAFTVIR